MKILYFAWVREQIGIDQEDVDLPSEVRDVAELISWLATRSTGHHAALADPSRLRTAVDNRFALADQLLAVAREVAIFPPVTGG